MDYSKIYPRILSEENTAMFTPPVAGGYSVGPEFQILKLEDQLTDFQVRSVLKSSRKYLCSDPKCLLFLSGIRFPQGLGPSAPL